jgi:hypothetical protein
MGLHVSQLLNLIKSHYLLVTHPPNHKDNQSWIVHILFRFYIPFLSNFLGNAICLYTFIIFGLFNKRILFQIEGLVVSIDGNPSYSRVALADLILHICGSSRKVIELSLTDDLLLSLLLLTFER